MTRCGLYARVSTTDQAVVKDGSLDTQLELLEDAVKLRTRTSAQDWRVVARYREEGQSGATTNRPEYQRMLADAEAKAFAVLLVDDLSRLSRDDVEQGLTLQNLLFWDIRVIGISDG